jgi:undecaprenyl-diphosphatase
MQWTDEPQAMPPAGQASPSPGQRPEQVAPPEPELTARERKAVEDVRQALEDALRSIERPEQAEQIVEHLLQTIADRPVDAVADSDDPVLPQDAVEAVRHAAQAPGQAKLEQALIEAARQIAGGTSETRTVLEEAAQEAVNPEQRGVEQPSTAQPRDWLMRAVIKRMRPLQKADVSLFLAINGLPHTRFSNRVMSGITSLMNGGSGWIGLLLLALLVDQRRGRRALRSVLPPLWLATMAIEYPVKRYFRRRRPFIDVVRAIAVGRKPGGYSFPSGHSAAAFAGAWLMQQHYPELARVWYTFAVVIGFSRIYLGVHYPGDVLSGAASGTAIAAATYWLMEQPEE